MQPEVKATHAQLGLEANQVLGPQANAVAARCTEAIEAIRAAGTGSWIPVANELTVVEAVAAVCGLAGVRRRVCHQVLMSADGPLLKPIREGAMRVLGVQPGSLLRFSSHGWRSSFRDCGTLDWTMDGTNRGSLIWKDPPSILAGNPAWAECLAGAVEAVYALCATKGQVVVVVNGDGARLACSW